MTGFGERVAAALPRRLQAAWQLISRTVADSLEDRVPGLAAEAAFFALLAIPPLLVVVLGTAAYIGEVLGATEEIRAVVVDVPRRFLSGEARQVVERIIDRFIAEERGGLVSVSLLAGLWIGARATQVYLDTIRIAYDVKGRRSVLQRRLLALGLTVVGVAVGVVLMPALVVGPRLVAFVTPAALQPLAARVVEFTFWPAVGLVSLALLTTMYHVGVPHRTPWRRDVPGAVLAGAIWLLGSYGLRVYVDVAFRGRSAYGPLAAPIVVLLWLYVTALAVLLGAELNAEIQKLWPQRARRGHEEGDGSGGKAGGAGHAAEQAAAAAEHDHPSSGG